jgi:small basic protein (TIGR04137 family)
MSMDRSLKSKASLSRHRNVLSRAERIKLLTDQEKFKPGDRPIGLPKVAHRKVAVGGKTKKAPKEGALAEGAAPAAAGAAPAPAATAPAKPAAKTSAKK